MADQISFTSESFRQFKVEYTQAKEAGKEIFVFKGKEILVAYAKYLIEYLEPRFQS